MITPFRVLVTGSRDWTDQHAVWAALADAANTVPADRELVIVHGACPTGADNIAHRWAVSYGAIVDAHLPNWDACAPTCPTRPDHRRWRKHNDIHHPGALATYCPGAGPRRNRLMVSLGADVCLAFPDPVGPSYGTRGCMRLAEAAGLRVREVKPA